MRNASIHKFTALAALTGAVVVASVHLLSAQTASPVLLAALRVNKKMGALAFIDPASGKILARVPTGDDPHGVTATPDGKTAYVANTSGIGGDSISVIDLAARKEVDRVQTGPGSRPHDILVAGGKVYFTARGYKAVGRYDPANKTIAWFGIGQQGPHMLTLSPDGKTLYAANPDSHSVAVIEDFAAPGWKLSLITVGGEGEGLDASPDGKEVWTADGEENGGVSIINLATKQVQSVPLQTVHTNRLEISPDGQYVFVLDRSEDAELIIVDAASRKIVKRMRPGVAGSEKVDFDVRDVAFAPDSSRAFVTTRTGASRYIAVIDLKTLNMTSQIDLPIGADEMVWVRGTIAGTR